MNRYRASLLAAATVLIALTGCGSEPDGPSAMTTEETVDEYLAETASLQLPPGWSWPDEPILPQSDIPGSEGDVYQPGFGKAEAGSDWYCAWSRHAMKSTDEELTAALETLGGVVNTYYYQESLLNDGRTYVDSLLDKAKSGDFRPMANYVDLGCRPSTDYGVTP